MAGCARRAKNGPIPTSRSSRAAAATGRSAFTPSASSTSKLPVRLEAARLPCFATGTPAPATTKAAVVETLKLPLPSPPVPQVSMQRGSGNGTVSAWRRSARAAATISPTVSPFVRSATSSAAMRTGLAAPLAISSKAASSIAAGTSRPPAASAIAAARLMQLSAAAAPRPPWSPRDSRGPPPRAAAAEEVREQRLALPREDRLGMELHALDRELAVAHRHDLAVVRPSRELERLGAALALDHQAVVARRLERARQAGEEPAPVVVDLRGLAVHQRARAHHTPAEGLADALVPEADAEHRDAALREGADRGDGDAGVGRPARARRDDERVGRAREQLGHGRDVVADDLDVRAELAQVLDEVVREGVVVIDHQQPRHQSTPSRARSMAWISARALFSHSRYSRRGSESATMPAPACTETSPRFTSMVRMVIARSMLPE